MLWGRTNPGLDPEPSLVNSKSFTDVWWWIPRVSSVEWVSLCQYCVSMLCWRCHSPWGGHSLWCQEAAGASLAFNQLLLAHRSPPHPVRFLSRTADKRFHGIFMSWLFQGKEGPPGPQGPSGIPGIPVSITLKSGFSSEKLASTDTVPARCGGTHP